MINTINTILSTLTGTSVTNSKSVIEQGYVGNSTETAGCLIRCPEVYSICKGTILSVNQDPRTSTWCVTVEINSQKWIRYCRLSSTELKAGQTLNEKDFVGFAYRRLMRLEYCTSYPSQFPVRETNKQLYKHDPTPIIFSQERLVEGFYNA